MTFIKTSAIPALIGALLTLSLSSCVFETDEWLRTDPELSKSEGTVPSFSSRNMETPEAFEFTLNEEDMTYEVSLNKVKSDVSEVYIPSSYNGHPVTAIAEKGFWSDCGPRYVFIPKTITKIGETAFDQSGYGIETIDVSPDNPCFSDYNGMLFNKDQTELIRCPRGKERDIKLPNTVLTLHAFCFYKCNLSSFTGLPRSVRKIGGYAFDGVKDLASTLVIPDSVLDIGCCAFRGGYFDEIILGNSVEIIREGAFEDCGRLTLLDIPGSVKTIEPEAFKHCGSLRDVTLNAGLEAIGEEAFAYCPLKTLSIPGTVSSISPRAFMFCGSLESFDVSPLNADYSDIDGVLFDKNQTKLLCCPALRAQVTIPDTVTSIGDDSFFSNKAITSIVIPDSVTKIGVSAFYGCAYLEEVSLGRGVSIIYSSAFKRCTRLVTFTYAGTMSEWEAIRKDSSMFSDCPLLAVTCSDGQVSLAA